MACILLLEDDRDIAEGLVYTLQEAGHTVTHAATCAAAIGSMQGLGFDLLLLDISLPDGSGYDVFRHAAQTGKTPAVFLTARDDEANVVMGLDMGAQDYITKPFRVRELLSRINNILRRTAQQALGEIRMGALTLLPERAEVRLGGEVLALSAIEYRLLVVLSQRPGQLFSRVQLLENIWDTDETFVNDNTLSVAIKRLREKLAGAAPAVSIVTVRGLGYRLEVNNAQ
ncbi:MAG: response regulator transcription factor [Oscillospiraceae bacterium]